ncbi:MAG: 3-oxoacyl-[acyl-carrier-protein] reductase [Alphaproteobacteria bacterium]|nr:3-oxoacyl-[acyl-carrier-protein] reductase [Alphaproteobacteria bacterium]MCL2504991.1 3-oxoacyl-[acyl-carrier-protein] reductase [Alphaproteobacteria bacterium]
MFSLSGKNALVTGASGGIGRVIAKTLHAQGARVVLADIKPELLEPVKAELGDNVFCVSGNLADSSVPQTMLKEAEEQLGSGVDILVNNAGLTRDGLAIRMKDEDWDLVLNVNLSAAFRLSRAVVKGMMTRRYGRIVNITSVIGVTGNAGQANYAASKAGLIAMSKSFAQELATRNVTVNCVAPGFIASAMTDVLTEEQKTKILVAVPMGRIGVPSDVASSVLFLASEEAGYITGQTIHVNGGMAMI